MTNDQGVPSAQRSYLIPTQPMTFYDLRQKYNYLSHDQWTRFAGMFHRMEAPARTILLREGEVASKAFWIEKGCLRVWFDNKGQDTTFQFFFEGQGISSLESFKKSIPGFFTIETIETCVLYWVSKQDLMLIISELEQHTEYDNQLLEFIFERQFHYMKEFMSFIRDTPTERYVNLMRDRPHIIQRVPQHYIASYLGITSVSLSRIRSRLLRDQKKQPE